MQSDNQFKPEEKVLKREDELTDISKLPNIKAEESHAQRERVKQGGINIEDDLEHHGSQPSTMHSLSLENLSSTNLDEQGHAKVPSIYEGTIQSDNLMSLAEGQISNRASKKSAGSPGSASKDQEASKDQDAAEVLHKGWEKATDTIAQGVEVVKRIIMHELPPVEGDNLKEKAENLASKASEKIDEVKTEVKSQVENLKESSQDISNKASEKIAETKEQAQESQPQESKKYTSRASELTDLSKNESGSQPEWQPTQQMKDVARDKLGQYKEKFNLPAEFPVPEPEQLSSQPSDTLGEIKDQAKERVLQAKQSFDNWSTQSNEGSQAGYQTNEQESQYKNFSRPAESQPLTSQATEKLGEMKDKVKGQVQEAKQSFQDWSNQSGEQKEQSSSQQESSEGETVFKIEHGKEVKADKSSSEKIKEIEELSQQLNQKVEQLKKSTDIPSNNAGETIIIIQQGGQGTSSTQQSQEFSGSQESQSQERPKLGKRDEQQWRYQQSGSQPSEGQSITEKISDKAQDLKESFKQNFQPQGSEQQSQEFSGSQESQSQERPRIGKRDEQQWRSQQGESQPSGQGFSDKISEKTQELKEGFRQGFEKGFEQPSSQPQSSEGERPKLGKRDEQQWRSQQGESQSTEGSQSLTGKLGDKIQQKASELKDSYQSNLEELERKANERYQQTEKPQEHHESEHHLTTESQSFQPTSESKSLVEKEILHKGEEKSEEKGLKEKLNEKVEQVKEMIPSMTEEQPEHHLKADSESFQPSSESKSLVEKELPQGTEGKGLKEKLNEKVEQIKEKIPSSSEAESFIDKAKGKVEEASDKIMSLDEAEKQDRSSEDKDQSQLSQGPPAEMKESITYHPREIRGYEIEYVPKDQSEGEKSQPQSREQSESQSKSEEESKPVEERVPLLDRIQHGIENVSHTYQTIKGIFKPSTQQQGEETQKGQGSEEKGSQPQEQGETLQNQAPPEEMVESITYHPRDIRGYKVEYVPKEHQGGEQSQSKSQDEETQEQKDERHHYEYRRGNYIVEYIEKEHSEQPKEEESESKPAESRVPLAGRVQHGMETVKGLFKSNKGEQKESSETKATGAGELSNIISQQAEELKTKYSHLQQDQPQEKELSQSQGSQESQEAKGQSLIGKVQGGIHGLTDKLSHGVDTFKGKFKTGKEETQQKEEPKTIESPREKIYEFHPTKKVEEKPEEKTSTAEGKESFTSKISGKISQGFGSVKGKFTSGKEESLEETSTEQNQSLFEKLQGKIQGKQTGEEVDKDGFREVHGGFTETVVEFKHEQNEEFLDQVEVANENPFDPLRTKQAEFVDQPTSNVDLVGGQLKEITADFKEGEQEMIPEDKEDEEGQKKGLFQKMKAGLFSKFGHGDKENVESSDK